MQENVNNNENEEKKEQAINEESVNQENTKIF